MAGLAAILARREPIGAEAVERMLAAAPHRGRATEVVAAGSAVLGVSNDPDRRESTLAASGGLAAAFSGALDNRLELNRELEQIGHPVSADTPAATVLAAFQAWRAEMPSRLRGVFAAAVTDGETLWCCRDQMGFRTLFFREEPRGFFAATEAKQVLAGAGIPREPDVEAVEAHFFGRLPERQTVLKGVERFPRAHACVVPAHGAASFRRYWDPSHLVESANLSLPEASERLAELLERVIVRGLTGADAVLLSGGIDSPAIAAFAAPGHLELANRPLAAVSSVFPDLPSVDESRYIRLVADRLSLSLHTFVPSARPLDDLLTWVDLLDGPTNALTVPGIAESLTQARRAGAFSVLNGDLAEYVFTRHDHLISHLILRGRLRAATAWIRQKRTRGRPWRRIGKEILTSLAPAFVAGPYIRLRNRDVSVVPWLISTGRRRRGDLEIPPWRRWRHAQIVPVLSDYVSFEATDTIAASCGVIEKKPLADVDLWEFFLSLPAEVKFPDLVPKSLMRQTLRGRLPDEILDRRDKTAFDAHALKTVDYAALRRWLLDTSHRFSCVDYALLTERLERQELGLFEIIWAYDLSRANAFLSLWE